MWGNSNKYPKHIVCEEIRIKRDISYISFCSLRILYKSKFILMATSLGTNAAFVTRVHSTHTLIMILYSSLGIQMNQDPLRSTGLPSHQTNNSTSTYHVIWRQNQWRAISFKEKRICGETWFRHFCDPLKKHRQSRTIKKRVTAKRTVNADPSHYY